MAFLRRWLFAPWLVSALFIAARTLLFAQNAPTERDASQGSLAGRLTDLNSLPLARVALVLRNESTGAEMRTLTTRNGSYRFASLDAGEYTLTAESAELGRGQLEGVAISAGHEARVQAAIDLEQPHEDPAAVRVVVPQTIEAAATTEAPQTRTPTAISSTLVSRPVSGPVAGPIAGLAIAQERPLRVAESAPVQFAAVEPVPIRQPTVEVEALEPERSERPAAVETASIAAPVALPANPAAAPAPELSASLVTSPSTNVSTASGVEPMIRAVPLQLLPIAAAIARVETVVPVLATTLSDAEVAALPAAGRNWQNFALETPATSASAGSSQPVYRGEDQAPAEITIDGAPTRLAFGAAADTMPSNPDSGAHNDSNSMGQAWNGGRGFSMTEAGVRQVQTVAGNVEAEAAHGTGGRIAVKTAHGENQLHGQAFLFDRQNTWGAQNPFSQWVTETAPATLTYNPSGAPLSVPIFDNGPTGAPESYTPPDHEMVWGLGLGSHIRRDKLFWFAALDSYHRNDPGVSMVKYPYLVDTPSGCGTTSGCTPTTTGFFATPSASQLQLLSAQLGLSSANPEVEGLTAYSQMLEMLAGLLGPAPRSAAQWVGFGRIDWQAAERHRITLEGIGASWNAPGGGLTRLSENYGNHSYGSSEAGEQWLLARWEAYLTPNLLTTTQGSAGRDILSAKPSAPSAFENTLLSGNAWGQLPQIVVDSRYGFTIGNPSRFGQGSYPDEKLYHAQQMLDWVHNRLLFKAGVEVDHNADSISLLRNQTGTYSYSKVQNFISDALAFQKFGLTNLFNDQNPHNCNPQQNGLGALPCYSHYSQTLGPSNWNLSTSDFAGFATAQWQPANQVVVSLGLRWEREKLPPPIAAVDNPQLPLTEKLPDLGNNWGPRVSIAIGNSNTHLPVLRLGYGMYYGRTENATLETALSQTGSLKGDLNFFIRPTDGMNPLTNTSDAPPFPYVLEGTPASVVKPGAVEFASNFRNPEVHQAVVSVEEALPGQIQVTGAAIASLGRRLPVFIDPNLNPPSQSDMQTITYDVCDQIPSGPDNGRCGNLGLGPVKATQITVPFYASWPASGGTCPYYSPTTAPVPGWLCPDYQRIDQITSKANSTYEAAMVKVTRYGRRGLSLHAHYTYAHAMDWNPDASPLNPTESGPISDFSQEYGTSNLDVRHSAAAMVIYETPWKMRHFAGMLGNGWMLSSIGQFRSGLPYTMHTSGSLPQLVDQATGVVIEGLGPGMNGSGGDNRVYGVGNDGIIYNIGRDTFRYPHTWKADMRLAKRFDLGKMRDLELMAESFNLFNHQNVSEIETNGYSIDSGSPYPTLNFMTGLKTNTTAFGQPLSINGDDLLRERQIQFGMRMQF
ncbi:MAG: carboxypeptidase regulatory-like domain-containing protein [Terracidiphilus sp.]